MPPALRVLVVDDEPAIRHAIATIVQRGYPGSQVDEVASGEEALRALRDREGSVAPYDVFVSNENMGGMTGLDLMRETEREGIRTRGILVTGDPAAFARASDEGRRVLPKPFEASALLRLLDDARRGS